MPGKMERVKSAGRERISAAKEKKRGRIGQEGRNRICIARAFFSPTLSFREKNTRQNEILIRLYQVFIDHYYSCDALIGLLQHIFFANTAFPLLLENQYRQL